MYTIALCSFYRKLNVCFSGTNDLRMMGNCNMEAKEDIVMVQLHKPPAVYYQWCEHNCIRQGYWKNIPSKTVCLISCTNVYVCVHIYIWRICGCRDIYIYIYMHPTTKIFWDVPPKGIAGGSGVATPGNRVKWLANWVAKWIF